MTKEEIKDFCDMKAQLEPENEDIYNEIVKILEQEPTTKNNLGVDYRSLEDIKKLVERKADALDGAMLDAGGVIIGLYFAIANDLPSVTPQEPIIDKIRAEIEQTVSRYSISRERGGMGQVEWSDRLIKESEVLKIFDKYISGK